MKIEIKYALIYLIASFIWSCIEFTSGLESKYIAFHPYFVTPFYLILTGVIYFYSLREKRTALQGKLTFRKGLMSGVMLSFWILLLNPIPFYIFNTFINPQFFTDFAHYNIETQKMTATDANAYFTFNNMLIRGTLYRFIMGIVASFILAACMKKPPKKQ